MRLFRGLFYLTIVLFLPFQTALVKSRFLHSGAGRFGSKWVFLHVELLGFYPHFVCVGLLFGALQALLLPFYQTAFNLRNAISTYLRLSETRTFRLVDCSSSSSKLERKNSTRRLYPNFGNLSLLRFTDCTTWGLQGCVFFPCFIGLGWEVSWGSWGLFFESALTRQYLHMLFSVDNKIVYQIRA